MKKLFTVTFLFANLSFFAQQLQGDHVPGNAIILLSTGTQVEKVIAQNYLIDGNPSGLQLKKALSKSMNIWLLEFDSGTDENKMLRKLNGTSGVVFAQFNHYLKERVTVPTDTYFSSMWALDNTGQSGGTVDADIDAPEAWDITTGGITSLGDTIVVAVIDGGFQLSHTDLNFWKNYGEISGNGIDDDGNGYIDDRNGWNALNSNGTINSSSHGTHVTGTVGAKGNNASGTTGVSWNVKVMPVVGSTSQESEAVEAYSYVRDNRLLYNQTNGAKGAFVVATNSSFGVDQGQPASYPIWCAMYDSLGAVGILSAGATANQNWNIDVVGDIPTSCASNYLISVTNTTRTDVKYSGAGYGATTIDIGAPGTTIYSTVPTSTWSQSSWVGTSMATPHVAGTIGLMYAAACPQFITDYKSDPAGKALLMFQYLMNGADVLTSLNGLCVSNGRLNAYNALLNVQSYAACSATSGFSLPAQLDKNEMGKIYPNPGSNWVEIEYTSAEDNFDVVVADLSGQVVKRLPRVNHKGINKHKLDLGELTNGIYFIGTEGNNSKSNFLKFVKLN
jgi:hypothetical protein